LSYYAEDSILLQDAKGFRISRRLLNGARAIDAYSGDVLNGLGLAVDIFMNLPEKKLSGRFVVGVGLIVAFSLFCGYINIGLFFLFGVPLIPILIGVILVWFSPQSWKHGLAATVLIFPCFIAGFAIFYWSLPRAEPESFLIPKGFRGTFVIVFVQGCTAEPIAYEDGRRVYRIPNSGVLFQEGDRTFGVMDQQFYILDDTGGRTRLPVFHYSNYDEERNSWRWRFSNAELNGDTLGVFWAYWSYEAFTVSTFRQTANESLDERKTKNATLDKLIAAEMKKRNCVVK
jgi:hypothetical protein